MDKIETIKFGIEFKMVIGFRYEGKVRFAAPLCLGTHKDSKDLKMLAIYAGGFSQSKFDGKNNQDLRFYDLDKIINPEPQINGDFETNASSSYVKEKFSNVIVCIS